MNRFSDALVRNPNTAWQQAVAAVRKTHRSKDLLLFGFRPRALFLPVDALNAHAYIVGPSEAGKTSRILVPLSEQLLAMGHPVWCIDCKPDPHMAAHLRTACSAASKPFRFFSLLPGAPSEYALDLFQALRLGNRSAHQVTEILLPCLGLDRSKEQYFADKNRGALALAIERAQGEGKLSFRALAHQLRSIVADKRFEHASQALEVIESLADVDELNPKESKLPTLDLVKAVRSGDACLFCLPVSTERKRVCAAVANLVLKLTSLVTRDLALQGSCPRRIYLAIDEFQDVAPAGDLADLLGQVRGIGGGISLILAHQVPEQIEDTGLRALLASVGAVVFMAPRACAKLLQEWSGEKMEWLESESLSGNGWGVSFQETIRPSLDLNTIQDINRWPGFGIAILGGGKPTPMFFPHHISLKEANARQATCKQAALPTSPAALQPGAKSGKPTPTTVVSVPPARQLGLQLKLRRLHEELVAKTLIPTPRKGGT